MKLEKIVGLFLCLVFLIQSFSAFETDQYNLPIEPLADIGDEVADYALENLRKAVGELNAEIAAHQACLDASAKKNGCDSPEKERARLRHLRSEEALARAVFKPLGGGIPPFTNSGTWMESHKFTRQPARFKTSFGKSIYRTSPILYLTISETVKLYGVELGTDKIAHIFQQGYTYYRIVERARAKKSSSEEGVRKAVKWGRMTEKTYYGYWVSGVYSNADLAANYAGMKFYENLTREIKIGANAFAPILILRQGVWTFNENINLPESLLKPFISNHLNEAFNPSVFVSLFGFRGAIRRTVKKQACPQWQKRYPNLSAADFEKTAADLKSWHGEDYGFKSSADFITVANTCFDAETEK
jgi:hypothetical protein